MNPLSRLGRALLFAVDPETAHDLALRALKLGLSLPSKISHDKRMAVELCGLTFPNPLGLAAGFDKNGEVPDALLALGFGFAEIGSITPKPQAGNPRPRIFRLAQDAAVINRLGFNNDGHERCHQRLVERRGRAGLVGVNIGANKDSADRIGDYVAGVNRFAAEASYLTINISSPNTPGLRGMHARRELGALLSRVTAARASHPMVTARTTPLFVKIAPDLSETELEDIAAEVLERPIDGVIVSNTTVARPQLRDAHLAKETGGLSGKPLFSRSTIVLAKMRRLLGPDVAIIGVGGVDSAETAIEKIRAGADLVQLYTGMIYGGPGLPSRILKDLVRILEAGNIRRVADLRDTKLDFWASGTL